MPDDGSPRIYLLPNLMTAGNLFCGFLATLKIVQGALAVSMDASRALDAGNHDFKTAIWCILAACIFDLLDGRLARLGGTDSPFGREFDSLADIVSFGVAPALLVSRVVLRDFEKLGWMVASIYLVCGAMRLARFNCIAASGAPGGGKEFKGFPIPAAAGLIASITLFMLWLSDDRIEHGLTKWVLPPLLVFLSWMMFSSFKYPSFKNINWRTTRSVPKFIAILMAISLTVMYYHWMPAVLFITYLLYGFLRPFLSRQIKEGIEEEIEDEEQPERP
jgi:CDP-diacylglycerol--serine O-phosphatidyltransferase